MRIGVNDEENQVTDMSNKPWLQSYPEGVPEFSDVDAYDSVVDLFEESISKFGSNESFISMGKSITYAELDEQSKAFAAWLQNSGKFEKGDRVAVMMPNLLQYPIAVFGILRALSLLKTSRTRWSAHSTIATSM